jgi:transcriptional antiterminator NusG
MEWFSVKVHTGREEKIGELISKYIERAKLEGNLGEILTPTREVTKDLNRYRRKSKVNLCPGYIFIKLDINDEIQNLVNKIPGIYGFLINGNGKPNIIREEEIERMKDLSTKEKIDVVLEGISIGSKVKIKDGPFVGFEGELTEIKDKRCKVSVPVFGRATPVEIDADQLEVIL